jgi:hypothetical protein
MGICGYRCAEDFSLYPKDKDNPYGRFKAGK